MGLRRRIVAHAILVIALVVAAIPATLGPGTSRSAVTVAQKSPPSATPLPSPFAPVEEQPSLLPLDVAVGQMMAASFGGPAITDGLRHLILDEKVGTVLVFGDNFTDAASLARLTADLQALGRQAGLPAPLLVTLDEEGGRVMRVTDGVAALPSEQELGGRGPQG
ncbi:MAG TPA: glycoside hydrolase family 3 N-terminal domain-containing protein, partial [Candidatus Dormibacteraeota bacterium]|nr:glycoside hydrolase family 3 N-terminal domain-containing protein [Candidatus Dormibacteraeota bacterium]